MSESSQSSQRSGIVIPTSLMIGIGTLLLITVAVLFTVMIMRQQTKPTMPTGEAVYFDQQWLWQPAQPVFQPSTGTRAVQNCSPYGCYTVPQSTVGVVKGLSAVGNESPQQACEREALYMAENQIKGHVGSTIGDFEGCGWSSDRNAMPRTCTPPRGDWVLVGDAVARNETGSYRVTSWNRLD